MRMRVNKPFLREKSPKEYWFYLTFVIFSVFFLLGMSSSTSPLFSLAKDDSAIFIMLGKLLKEGYTPYVDFFDHKGPSLIFIEGLGQCFSSDMRLGIFILQIINLSICLILIYNCSRYFLSVVNSLTIVLGSLVVFSYTILEGNLTEEYSLPFLLLSLLIAIECYCKDNKSINSLQILILGISAAVIFWMRPNNIGVLVGCTLFIFIITLINKDIKGILRISFLFILGFVIISAFILIYFYAIGAFKDMIYATFIFNYKYAEASKEFRNAVQVSLVFYLYNFKVYIAIPILGIGVFLFFLKTREIKLSLLALILLLISIVTTQIGNNFAHYMTLNLPCAVLGSIMILYVITNMSNWKIVGLVLNIVVFVLLAWEIITSGYIHNFEREKYADIKVKEIENIVAEIPFDERNSVYAYQVPTFFWVHAKLIPYFKYFVLQEWHGMHDKKIIDEVDEMMDNNSPLWVVVSSDENRDKSNNKHFWNVINSKYNLYGENDDYHLYHLVK